MSTAGTRSSEVKLTGIAAAALVAISAYSPTTIKPELAAQLCTGLVGAYAVSRGAAKLGKPTT